MAEFEDAYAQPKFLLSVLSPKKPEYYDGVERGNRNVREEFYNRTDLWENSVRGTQSALSNGLVKYNTYRPHRNLKVLTPSQYIKNNLSETLILSHWSMNSRTKFWMGWHVASFVLETS